ncbi:RDD family protein [Breznakia pachnodae]|uniref:Metal-dependent phosphoesterase TrpH/uncharacterized RDD family membrane protein YckC n=1 Tax=Breznakia pachnodae TaxID=265178 RepID=A0ABU0E3K4_9FIRM|nr:RDD family protein [Breznakia pachnodae]MDQ0361324.1 putative metal-dependent phosphoesterase TrpH/uncharacterized RDD family membrane protein YckC [Breznakia pachnodae]
MAEKVQTSKKTMKEQMKVRSSDYNQYGRYLAQDFTYGTLWLRFIGQLGDFVVMLLPMILWVDLFLLVANGYLSIDLLYSFMPVTLVLILIFTVVGNTYLSVMSKGQSFGKLGLRTKVVNSDNTQADRMTLLIREAVGKEIPLILLYIFTGLWGVLGFLVVNGLVVLIDPKHRSIIDFLLKTKVVMLSEMGRKPIDERIKEEVVVEQPKAENTIDLKLVSSFSHDGEYGVEDLLKQAKEVGLKTISICDHNSVKANLIAQRVSSFYDIEYIPGINIDCQYNGKPLRLLGYFINSNDERFVSVEYENLAKEKAVSLRRIQLFEEATGLMIDSEQIIKHSRFQVISPEMIARHVLTNVNYKDHKLLQPYLKGEKKNYPIRNFVDDFFAEGEIAYVPIVHPAIEDMLSIIKASGGVAVLAHPMYYFKDEPELLNEVLDLGIEAIEIFNPRHSNKDKQYLLSLAKQRKLYVTAGSEYHGESKKQFILGKTTCPVDGEVVVQEFIDKYKKVDEVDQGDEPTMDLKSHK